METVFVVQYLHVISEGKEDIKFIGVYRTSQSARAAIDRLSVQPGFRDDPHIIDPLNDDCEEGFYLDEYALDKDHWAEGFVTE
jgi:hypothetical protein